MHLRVNGGSLDDPAQEALLPQMISVTEQSNGLIYRARETNNNTLVPNFAYRAAVLVRHRHARVQGRLQPHARVPRGVTNYAMNPLSYRFNNGVPNQITMSPGPTRRFRTMDNDLGLFAQDRWTHGPADGEPGAALRLLPDQLPGADDRTGAARTRPATCRFPEQTTSTGRTSPTGPASSYDLGGNGKTAVKVAFNKYLLGQTLNGIGRNPNPVLAAHADATGPGPTPTATSSRSATC